MDGLFDRRLIFVTGKGGVGKTTVATALGMAAADQGLRTVVAELAGQSWISQAFGFPHDPFVEMQLTPNLFTISIEPQRAMEEYLQVKAGALAGLLSGSRMFGMFAMATPGMRELLSIGKIWELAQLERQTRGAAPYDLVIVDAPATGHGAAILRTPRTFAEIARVGPIARQAGKIATTIANPSLTAIVAVTTAEEMPVNETLAAARTVAEEGLALDGVVVNALYPERFTDTEIDALRAAASSRSGRPADAAARAAVSEHARARTQREQLIRLRAEMPAVEIVELPYLFVPSLGPAELELLAARLAAAAGTGAAVA